MGTQPEEFDPQTRRVYEAESFMMWLPIYDELMSLDDIKKFLRDIFDSRWFHKQFGWVTDGFVVHDGRGAKTAIGRIDFDTGMCHLTLPRSYRKKLIVLHELAHGVGQQSHGGYFCSAYLRLVRQYMGKDAWAELRWQFQCAGVKYRRPPCFLDCDEHGTLVR